MVAVACYYTNVWNTGYLPFQSSKGTYTHANPGRLRTDMRIVFDNTGGVYKVKKIVNAASGYKLDVKKYLAYSPVSRFLFPYPVSHADTRSHLGLHAHHLRTEHVRAVLCDPECSTCLGHS
jgi:hypothetical protein